jgi:integrase
MTTAARAKGQGTIRELKLGQWQGRYRTDDGKRHSVYGRSAEEVEAKMANAVGRTPAAPRPEPRARAAPVRRAHRGQGSLREKTLGLWEARYIDENGRQQSLYASSEAEAASKLRDALSSVEKGLPVLKQSTTVEAMLTDWLTDRKGDAEAGGLEWSTYRFYDMYVNNHLIPGLGKHRLVRLQPADIERFMRAKVKGDPDAKPKPIPPASANTANCCRRVLRAALSNAMKNNLVLRNVAQLANPLKWHEAERKPLEPEEAVRLLAALRGERLEGLALLVFATGMREQEALGLQPENIDLEAGIVRVRTALARYDGRWYLKGLKHPKHQRDLRIPTFVIDGLNRWVELQEAEKKNAREEWQNELGLFFTTEFGRPLHGSSVVHWFQGVLERAGLPKKRFYDLRHGTGTYMLRDGHDLRAVQAQLGWTNLSMASRYTHALADTQDRVAATFDKLFAPSKN